MKILMLNFEFPPIGGGGGYAHRSILKEYAADRRITVDVLTAGVKSGLDVEEFSGNIRIHRVGIHKKDLHYWRKSEVIEWLARASAPYRRMLRENRYDLAHAFFGFPTGWLCFRTAERLPYILSLRGSDVPGGHRRLRFEYRILGPLVFRPIWKNASALAACSAGLRARALRLLPSAQIEVIPNGVDMERFRPAAGQENDSGAAGPDAFRLLTVGRLSATKRLPLLMDAVELLRRQGCRASLTIVGGGALKTGLEELSARRNFGGFVRVTGLADSGDMPDIYRGHDLFVSASMQEGMSNAMLEAMATGLPIVTTRCEGVDELIADNGVVVEDPRPDALARAVKTLLDDRETMAAMSAAARKRAGRFGWDNVAAAYLRLYANVK